MSQLWDFNHYNVEYIYIQWQNTQICILSVSDIAQCDLLSLIAANMSLEFRLDYRSIASSDDDIIKCTADSKL